METSVEELRRKMGIFEATLYNWRKKYGGLRPSELFRLRRLEQGNGKLKPLVAKLSIDKAMLQDVLANKTLKPFRKREWLHELMQRFGASERPALRIENISKSLYRYRAMRAD